MIHHTHLNLFVRLADCYAKINNYKDAEILYSSVLKIQPKNIQLYEKLSTSLFHLQKYQVHIETNLN
jgi:hypothetical protein